MAEKKKLTELSIMTGFLCCFVVMIHLTSTPLGALSPGSHAHIFIYWINKSLAFVVPSFLFLSGLKLTYSYGNQPFHLKTFFTKRFSKILIPYIFWYFAYYILFRILGYIEPKNASQHLFSFIMGDLVAPFYFITIVFQFYFLFGLLLFLFRKVKHIWIIIATIIIEYFYLQYTFIPYEDRFFATSLIYFILGCYAAYHLEDIKSFMRKFWPVVYCVFAFLLIWHVSHAYQSAYYQAPYPFWRLLGCAFSISATYCIYHFSFVLSNVLPKICISGFLWLDKASYGIFLCHSFWIYILNEHWGKIGLESIGKRFVLNIVFVYLISIFLVVGYLIIKKRCQTMILSNRKM